MEIYDEGRTAGKVFAVLMFEEINQYHSEWRPVQVNAYIKGPWVRDFHRLGRAIEKWHAGNQANAEAEETERQATAFGITKRPSFLLSFFLRFFRR